MVGGDRRSPPRHKAKGGGGRGKGECSNVDLGSYGEGKGMLTATRRADKEMVFSFGSEETGIDSTNELELQQHEGVLSKPKSILHEGTCRSRFSGAKSWALAVEAQEELQCKIDSSTGVAELVAGFEKGVGSAAVHGMQHMRSLKNRPASGRDNDSLVTDCLLQHDSLGSTVQMADDHYGKGSSISQNMCCDVDEDTQMGTSVEKEQLTAVIQIKSAVGIADIGRTDAVFTETCMQGVRGNANSASCSPQALQPITPTAGCIVRSQGECNEHNHMHTTAAIGDITTDGTAIREAATSGAAMENATVNRQFTQNFNVWKRQAHVRVDESHIENVTADGQSLNFDALAYESNKCKLCRGLVCKLIGRKLPLHILDRELSRRWGYVGGFRTILLGGDCFLCIFESDEARDKILMGGPWQILGHIIAMDKWTPELKLDCISGFSAPIWLRLPNLPLLFWDNKTITRIGAMVGVPMWIDAQTTVWGRCEYARVCVRMDLSKKLPTGIWIQDGSSKFFQPIAYEGISLLCFQCGIVGHKAADCSTSMRVATPTANDKGDPISHAPRTNDRSSSFMEGEPTKVDKGTLGSMGKSTSASLSSPMPTLTQLSNIVEEDRYGPWTLVVRKKRPLRQANKNQPPNFSLGDMSRGSPIPPPSELNATIATIDKPTTKEQITNQMKRDDLHTYETDELKTLKAQVDSIADSSPPVMVGSPPYHELTSVVGNMEVATSHQPHSRSGKERVSKAHFEKELLQLGPIALKSRKRKKKIIVAGAEQCLRDFTQATSSGGGDASPSRGK